MLPILIISCSLFALSQASLSLSKNELPFDTDFLPVPRFHGDMFLDALSTAISLSDRHQFAEGFSDTAREKPMKHFEERRSFNEITAEMPLRSMRRGGEEFMV